MSKPMISRNADSESEHQNSKCRQPMSANTLAKFKSAEKTLLAALVHTRWITLAFNVQETEQEDFSRRISGEKFELSILYSFKRDTWPAARRQRPLSFTNVSVN